MIDSAPELTPEQEDDLAAALREADEGRCVPLDEARRRIDAALKR